MPKPKYRRFDTPEPDGFRFKLSDGDECKVKFLGDTSAKEIEMDFDADGMENVVYLHLSDIPKLIQVLQEVLKQSTFKE